MKLLKRSLLVLVLIQLPFLYSVFETYRVARYLSSQAPVRNPAPPFADVRGGIHVHSQAGGHTLGTYAEIVEAARQAGYRYVMMTEHRRAQWLHERPEHPEILIIPGWEEERPSQGELLCTDDGAISFQTGRDRPLGPGVTGIEIFNLHDSAASRDTWYNRVSFLYHRLFYPGLFFFKVWELDPRPLARWDQALATRPATAIGGSDAHQNVGVVLRTAAGQRILSLMVDPYLESFTAVTTHVFLMPGESVSRQTVLEALKKGSAYIAFEKMWDPSGFSFHALQDDRPFPMGALLRPGARLVGQAPRRSVFSVLHNGRRWKEFRGARFEVPATETGYYRIEVFPPDPPSALSGKPWIISNAVFVSRP